MWPVENSSIISQFIKQDFSNPEITEAKMKHMKSKCACKLRINNNILAFYIFASLHKLWPLLHSLLGFSRKFAELICWIFLCTNHNPVSQELFSLQQNALE